MWDAAVVIRNEYRYPYSGSKDVVQYLKSVGADRQTVFGYLYGLVAVQAYYDHNILANMPTAYFHHGLPFTGAHISGDAIDRASPEYIIFASVEPNVTLAQMNEMMAAKGYRMVHFSDGYIFVKRWAFDRETYLIYKRVTP